MTDRPARASLTSAVTYQDPGAAFLWLETAFGFEPLMVLVDQAGNLAHSEMGFGDSTITIGGEWSDQHRSAKSMGGVNTQSVHVQLLADLDAHCERARQAGATILQEPETQFYGDRTYRAIDLEGHIWTFGMTVETLTPAEWDKASGFTTRTRL